MEETLMHSQCNYSSVPCTISELRSSDWQKTECFGKIENIETGM